MCATFPDIADDVWIFEDRHSGVSRLYYLEASFNQCVLPFPSDEGFNRWIPPYRTSPRIHCEMVTNFLILWATASLLLGNSGRGGKSAVKQIVSFQFVLCPPTDAAPVLRDFTVPQSSPTIGVTENAPSFGRLSRIDIDFHVYNFWCLVRDVYPQKTWCSFCETSCAVYFPSLGPFL